jgi:polysaccharide biosynthesis protein PslH
MARRFTKVVTVSEADRELFLSLGSGCSISIVSNGVDTRTYLPFPLEGRGKNILLIGSMDYKPNVDAALYFMGDIFPAVRKRHPDCTLTIVGKTPPDDIQRLAEEPGVNVHSNVADVQPYYQKALVSVVPLRSGGGTRLKILEAMAFGTPVVSTSIGCEGLDVENNRNILIADDPVDFAGQIITLLTDLKLWNRISLNGRDLVQENYDWEQISRKYRAILLELTQS